jgi:hypothetical protein
MNPMNKSAIFLPILLITFGVGWLLTTLGVAPRIDWVWTLCIAALGFLTLGVGGLDKVTVVVGPILLLASLLSILRQTGRLQFEVEVPILIIVMGVLLLLARLPVIPVPKWIAQAKSSRRDL